MNVNGIYTVLMLIMSNIFMTFAWYGHLRLREFKWFQALPLLIVVLLSWGIALFEYCFQIPANRLGYKDNGGPFNLLQLKVIQEAISISVFAVFTIVFFQHETIKWNHVAGFSLLIIAVYLVFLDQ